MRPADIIYLCPEHANKRVGADKSAGPRCNRLRDWLEKLGRPEYAQRFAENDIDFAILGDLTSPQGAARDSRNGGDKGTSKPPVLLPYPLRRTIPPNAVRSR